MRYRYFTAANIALLLAGSMSGQSVSEKRYDLTNSDQIFSSTQFVTFGTPGHILLSSTKQGAGSDAKAIITRTDDEGLVLWSTEYDPPGYSSFDTRSLVRSHRVGYNPESNPNFPGEFAFIAVGELAHGGYLRAGYIELDPTNGNVILERSFSNDYGAGGHLSAVHTVEDGPHAGAYMVGAIESEGWPMNYSPILIKSGSGSNYAYSYEVGKTGSHAFYHDVDVDEDGEGLVAAVGHAIRTNFGTSIIDTYDPASGSQIGHFAYDFDYGDSRISSVKCIGGQRALCGGSMNGNYAFVMEVDLTDGKVNWARMVQPGSIIKEGGIEVHSIGDVIEVELDDEARPIFMGVTTAHQLGYTDPVGPGIFARLDYNGVEEWAISEEMEGGFGDLEPQLTGLSLLASLTGISEPGLTSKLTFAGADSKGFSGCQSEINFEMPVTSVSTYEYSDRRQVSLADNDDSPNYGTYPLVENPGCCWLPYYSPLPWNHPWESTYWPHTQADFDAGSGYSLYQWNTRYTKESYSGNVIATNVGGSSQYFTIPFYGSGGTIYYGGKSAEISYLEITVQDADQCWGWDAAIVHIADDGYHNVPDYSTPANAHENEDYFYCQTSSTTPSRHLYEHHGGYLTTGGFSPSSPPTSPQNILNTSGFNYLATPGTKDFDLIVYDAFNAGGPPRTNIIHTDVAVASCGCNATTPGSIDVIYDNGRTIYSMAQRDRKIVKYSFGLHMVDLSAIPTLPDNVKLVKRYLMRNRASGAAIVNEDYLLPTIDDRYLKNYPSAYSGNQTMYLDVWYTTSPNYPYVICGHERIDLTSAVVARKKKPGDDEQARHEPGNDNSSNDDMVIYPNPSNGSFEISGLTESTRVSVIDNVGRTVLDYKNLNPSNGRANLNLEGNKPGVYLLKLTSKEGEVKIRRIVIN